MSGEEGSVVLRDLVKRFGEVTAVDGLNLEVKPGEFMSLLGPSGCGKTTTLRMLAGFEDPTEGDIRISGAIRARHPAPQARREHRLPALRALPAHDGGGERRVRAPAEEDRKDEMTAGSVRRSRW